MPEIVPGMAGVDGFTFTAKLLRLLIPQLFSAETLIVPLTALIAVEILIAVVPFPEVIVQSVGTDQLYVVAFGTVLIL